LLHEENKTTMNILVFPCGSEIGLEIHRALVDKKNITLYGLSSVNDHGRYVYENYIGDCPFVTHIDFKNKIHGLVIDLNIDAIYPANEAALLKLKELEPYIQCKVIGPSLETVKICNSKSRTYEALKHVVKVPAYTNEYPVFIKPDSGHSGINCHKVSSDTEMRALRNDTHLVLEYLPGREYTIDCFADLYAEGRERKTITKGIATVTEMVCDERFITMANAIQSVLKFPGAWFFQVKEDVNGELTLLEVGARIAGSSSLSRLRGINLPVLNLYNEPVIIKQQNYITEISRSIDVKAKINYEFDNIYIDLDDTLIVNGKVNYKLMGLIYKFKNDGKKVFIITRSDLQDIDTTLKIMFANIICLKPHERKASYMFPRSILIDDSFAERADVTQPAFDTDIVDALL
jgi:hypothetical protein